MPTLLGFRCVSKLSSNWWSGQTNSHGILCSEATVSWRTTRKLRQSSVFPAAFTAGSSCDLWLVQEASWNTSGDGLVSERAVRWNSLSNRWNFHLLCSRPFRLVTFQFSPHWDSVDVHYPRKMYLFYKVYHNVFSFGNRLMEAINNSTQEYLKCWLTASSYFFGLVFINFYINSANVQLHRNVLWNCPALLKWGSPQPLVTVVRWCSLFCEIKYGLDLTRKD